MSEAISESSYPRAKPDIRSRMSRPCAAHPGYRRVFMTLGVSVFAKRLRRGGTKAAKARQIKATTFSIGRKSNPRIVALEAHDPGQGAALDLIRTSEARQHSGTPDNRDAEGVRNFGK